MNLDEILPNLFLGSYPSNAGDVQHLESAGITGVLSVQSDEDHQYLGIDEDDLTAEYSASGLELRRVPIRDFDDEQLRGKLPDAVQTLANMLDNGRVGYVHCTAGMNRSPSVVVCYLHWMLDWGLDRAERHVKSCRYCDPVMRVVRLATDDWHRTERT